MLGFTGPASCLGAGAAMCGVLLFQVIPNWAAVPVFPSVAKRLQGTCCPALVASKDRDRRPTPQC